ncbi:MAG: hypothetical protein V1726_05585 [Methanobacteriota archaeon]
MDNIVLFLSIVMAGLSGLLFVVSFISWYRVKAMKFVFVSLAFFAFFIKAILLFLGVVVQDEKSVVIDSIIILLLYFSVIKKG